MGNKEVKMPCVGCQFKGMCKFADEESKILKMTENFQVNVTCSVRDKYSAPQPKELQVPNFLNNRRPSTTFEDNPPTVLR